MKPTLDSLFPGFEHSSSDLAKYIKSGNIFTIMLRSGLIVHFTPEEEQLFELWLLEHGVVNIKNPVIA